MNMNKMAKFLKKLREDRGLTQEQLGEIINVSRSLISKWENAIKCQLLNACEPYLIFMT